MVYGQEEDGKNAKVSVSEARKAMNKSVEYALLEGDGVAYARSVGEILVRPYETD
jgi:hypothetical protein